MCSRASLSLLRESGRRIPSSMKRKTFLCSYLTDKDGVTEVDEEQAIQNALAKAMREMGVKFVIAPPDLVKGGNSQDEE